MRNNECLSDRSALGNRLDEMGAGRADPVAVAAMENEVVERLGSFNSDGKEVVACSGLRGGDIQMGDEPFGMRVGPGEMV